MTDTFGAIDIPVAITAAGEDLLAKYVGEYFQAVANAKCVAEWAAVSGLAKPPITTVKLYDPFDANHAFTDTQCPTLFVHRADDATYHREASDIWLERGNLVVEWVPGKDSDAKTGRRSGFANKLFKVLFDALIEGRDPAWVVQGDTYYDAATYGSVLARHARFRRLGFGKATKKVLTRQSGTAEPVSFPCWELVMPYEEQRSRDLDYHFDTPAELSGTVGIPDDPDVPAYTTNAFTFK